MSPLDPNQRRISRRALLALGGVSAASTVFPTPAWALSGPPAKASPITDMTMNAPSYTTQIGYGLAPGVHDATDPLALAFG